MSIIVVVVIAVVTCKRYAVVFLNRYCYESVPGLYLCSYISFK